MYIYLITNKVNGKQYVGQTIRSIKVRFSEHCTGKGAYYHSPITNAIQKYGKENFTLELLGEYGSQEELDKAEQEFIESLNTRKPYGYNLCEGGNGGKKHEDTIARMRVSNKRPHKEETKEKIRQINLGKTLTEEHKQKISEGLKKSGKAGKYERTDEIREKIGASSKGRKQSLEARRKNSEKNSGEKNGNYGKKHSPEMRALISQRVKEALAKKKAERGDA